MPKEFSIQCTKCGTTDTEGSAENGGYCESCRFEYTTIFCHKCENRESVYGNQTEQFEILCQRCGQKNQQRITSDYVSVTLLCECGNNEEWIK